MMRTPSLARTRPWGRSLLAALLLAVTVPAQSFHFPWDQGHDTTRSNDPPPPGPCEGPNCDDDCNGNASRSPVYASLGHAIWRDTDVELRGRPYMGVYRAYNSNDPVVGLFGNGWSVCFDVALYPSNRSGTPERIYKAPNGKRFSYVRQADGSFKSPDGRFETVVEGTSSVTMRMLDGRVNVFALDGRLLERRDESGNRVQFAYDAAQRVSRMSDAAGRVLQIAYNAQSLVDSVTDHAGRAWRYGYDASANLVSVTDPAGGVRRYAWQAYRPAGDANVYQQLLSVTDPSGVLAVSFAYSGNQVASYTEGANRITYTRPSSNTALGGTVTQRDALNVATSFQYGNLGLVTRDTNGIGGVTTYTYDANGRVVNTVDPLGRSWPASYDALGRLLTSSNPLGQTTRYEYSGDNPRPARITSPGGKVVAMAYDAAGRLISATDPAGTTAAMAYDTRGDMVSITNGLGQRQTIVYDAAGLPLRLTDPLGRTSTIAYDALGRPVAVANAGGETTRFTYDALDRVTSIVDPLNQTTAMTYDAAGRVLTLTDPKGSATRWEYDAFGRRSAEVAPDGRRTTFSYRADNRLATVTWPDGSTASYGYDANKRIVTDTAGGETITFAYNALDQLTSATGAGGTVRFTYDSAGRIVSETSADRVQASTRDADGERTQLAALGQTIAYTRDVRGLVTRIATSAGNLDFGFDALGRRTDLAYPNGSTARWAWDGAGQLATLTHAGALNLPLAYAYDGAGRIARISGDGADWTYTYDANGRLVRAAQGAAVTAYTMDPVGNLLDGGRSYDANHRLTTDAAKDYAYDTRGNLVQETDRASGARTVYAWNVRNQLLRVETFPDAAATTPTRVLAYTYDAVGRRASKTDNGVLERYVYDGDDIVGTLDAAGTVTGVNVFSGSVDEPLLHIAGGGARTLHANHQGSVLGIAQGGALTHSYRYDAYGAPMPGSSADSLPFRYTGREKDGDSLYHYRARYYSTAQQRFLSRDPIGIAGGLATYAYVAGDPVNRVDPSGLCPWCVGAAIGFGFDLVSQLIENGGNISCIDPWRLAASTALGAVGGGLGGRGLTGGLRGLSNGTKGQIGETMSIISNTLKGSVQVAPRNSASLASRGLTTQVDSTWRSLSGNIYYVESKFGTAGLTGPQRRAAAAMGDAYHVERWGYPFFEKAGAAAGGAAGGAAGRAAGGSDCGCK